MKIKLIFSNSGDELVFDAVNPELFEYYLYNINKDNVNCFSIYDDDIPFMYNKLKANLNEVNSFITKFVDFKFDDATLDQQILNRIHYNWAVIQKKLIDVRTNKSEYFEELFSKCPDDDMVITVAEALGKVGLVYKYYAINKHVHLVEESFNRIVGRTTQWYEINNPFSKSMLGNTRYQLSLPFIHLGRTLHDKFSYRDDGLEGENSFNELVGVVSVNLVKTQTFNQHSYSQEYITWCKQRNREPIGEHLNLGQLTDIENRLTYYRQIIFNNVKMHNTFFLEQG